MTTAPTDSAITETADAVGIRSSALFGIRPYHEEAAVTIYHGDCRQIVPMLGRFDLLLTDPPYGIGIAANPVRQKHAKMEWDADVPDAWVLPMLLASAGKAIVWGGNYFSLPPQQCFLAWDKMQPEDFSLAMLEQAWTNLKGPAKMFRKSVTSYAKEHPTQKPVELLQWASPALATCKPSSTRSPEAARLARPQNSWARKPC